MAAGTALSVLFPPSLLQGGQRRVAPIPLLWVALGLSLLAHLAALFVWWPDLFPKDKNAPSTGGMGNSMRVMIVPPPPPPAAAASRAAPPAPDDLPAPPRAPRPVRASRPPPVMARNAPVPPTVSAAPPALPPTPQNSPQPAPVADLSAMIEARRRARAQDSPNAAPPSPVEDENARKDRIVAANMGTIRAPTLGNDPRRGGGIFEIRRVGVFDAQFLFYGWNKDVSRQMSQLIDVKLGDNPNMQIAVVRKMIAIIREHEKEDFTWQSPRLTRIVTLSARTADNAGLEEFFMREFFR